MGHLQVCKENSELLRRLGLAILRESIVGIGRKDKCDCLGSCCDRGIYSTN